MVDLLPADKLPKEFKYPKEFNWLVEKGIHLWTPWIIERGKSLLIRYEGMQQRYPNRQLIPFASRLDCDDVACWDLSSSRAKVFIIHDFSKPPFEEVSVYDSFWEWFQDSINHTIEFAKKDIIE